MRTPEEFELQLRQALRSGTAPADFAAKVLATARASQVAVIPFWRTRAALATAAALVVSALIPIGIVEHQRQERAVEASRQLVAALKITRSKLEIARQKVKRRHS